ncbi:lysophospholipid acyltransferase family protein [Phytomonospora endophytica]|uniref:1-acyl-sn-glycerol-3-phosphate acyltransferase n=1 Tax=Phytomonospora endophytica TaxID=714109 RepID=A0A841FAY2_9ACTN|nr:lysophospholipid acyltransferase family protein [Phytomonospora endophytica]MBB6032193.1 1-acyl-sn-glycerol-3-phosphate acyltransferase [Phytomonospora endophytica]GIG68542.1 1-acyl-sn-glycerol-3-phosphate acyltransferase [Phytomonospora endophytica]
MSGGWFPDSDCTPSCIPEPNALPSVGLPRRAARVVALASVLAAATVLLPLFPSLGPRLARAVLRASGVVVPMRPAPIAAGSLVVANHSSWIDVVALTALGGPRAPVRMLAKREVGEWPLLGWLAGRTRTLFVDRGSLRTLPSTVAAMAERLRGGESIGVFPEATTWCLPARGRFRRAPFQAAIDADAKVAPVTLWFTFADGSPTTAAAFLGTETFMSSLRRVLRAKGLRLHVIVSEPFPAVGDRRGLAVRAESAVVGEALAGLVTGLRERAAARAEPPAVPAVLVPNARRAFDWNHVPEESVETVDARRRRVLTPQP